MKTEEIATHFIQAMISSDIETMSKLLADDIEWVVPSSTRRHLENPRGKESVIEFLTVNPENFYEAGSRKAEILNVVANSTHASVHFNFLAKPKKGGELNTCANFMFSIESSKIIKVWEVLDLDEWKNSVLKA
jgi:ketosteroid isomerase-like protein